MTTTQAEFEVDRSRVFREVGGAHGFVIAVGIHPVLWNRSNGQTFHMTYRSRQGAAKTLMRVRATLPDATVEEKA